MTHRFPPRSFSVLVLWESGITHYDVASISEVRLVRATLPQAVLCFLHPVKTPAAIAEAYHRHGVKTFRLDTAEALTKHVDACRDGEGHSARALRLDRTRVVQGNRLYIHLNCSGRRIIKNK